MWKEIAIISVVRNGRITIPEELRKELGIIDFTKIDLESLISLLARIYLKRYRLPKELTADLKEMLRQYKLDWDLDYTSTSSQDKFWNWLNQEWTSYVSGTKSSINFSNQALLAILPSLLTSGAIPKINVSELQTLKEMAKIRPLSLIGVNFEIASEHDIIPVIETKLALIEKWLNEPKLSPELWLNIAKQWGQIRHLQYIADFVQVELNDKIEKLGATVGKSFQRFLLEEYDLIVTSSTFQNPQTVDKILGHISIRKQETEKVALAVFDGMGMAEWEIIRNYLENNSFSIKSEKQVFAILPTLTNYSRQAIFSGKQPNEFSKTIKNPREGPYFKEFWINSIGSSEKDILFDHIILDKQTLLRSNNEFLDAIEEDVPIIGIVFSFIDNLLHGPCELDVGKKLFHQSIRNFLSESCLADLFRMLLEKGYHLYMTSDHGSIFGTGNGYYGKQMLVERQGKRCMIYDRRTLAEEQQKSTDCSLFDSRFVPEDNFILFANGSHFFGNIKSKEITHGGISIEETIVPLSEIWQ